ncbi:MAG: diacylglycerol kinase family lipid kinase [Actinobacteria bacterium]|nr:diacylglycerol kinase family lipid kinase [Actinomycetota bacterium]
MRAHVLVNAGAGSVDGPDAVVERIVDAFAATGAEATVAAIDPDGFADAVLSSWSADPRPDVVVVAGGDGTVNCAAAAAAGTDVVLSVLPMGTFNHFAKDLGLPDDLEGAAAAIVGGEVRRVDVGEVNGEVFVNNSALGVYPTMVAERDRIRDARGWGKVRAVPLASLHVLRDLPVHRLDLVGSDGFERRRVRTPFVFIGNGRYDNGSGGAPERQALDDGRLQLAVTRATSRLGLVRAVVGALVKGAGQTRDLDLVELEAITVSGRSRRLRVARDGEIGWVTLPLRYRCRPGALLVRSPVPEEPGERR